MAYIGKTPTPAPLTSSDIASDIINSTHIGDTAISGFDALATAPADTDEFLISDGGVLKRLDASLIGGNNSPSFRAEVSSNQDVTDATATVTTREVRACLRPPRSRLGRLAPGTPCPVASTTEQNMSLREWRASTPAQPSRATSLCSYRASTTSGDHTARPNLCVQQGRVRVRIRAKA